MIIRCSSRRPIVCVLGIAALTAACVDPFKPDFVPQPGAQSGGTGGTDTPRNNGTGGSAPSTGGTSGGTTVDAAAPGIDSPMAPPVVTPDAAAADSPVSAPDLAPDVRPYSPDNNAAVVP